jgi:hypothetical protein
LALRIDTSRAIRTLTEQQQLIQAVVDAPPSEQETHWLEWKTDVDLAAKKWQAVIARHVLGFANRHPDMAAQDCDGTAYMIIGAAPGVLRGTPVHDVAKLNAWLSPYLGATPDSPQWSATYAEVGGANVLLLTIEKPRWGDPIWTLRKEYTQFDPPMRAGAIYVRRRGSTEQADPEEVRMLTGRAGSGPRRLSVDLRLEDGGTAAAIDMPDENWIGKWVARERAALARPPSADEVPPSSASEIGHVTMSTIAAWASTGPFRDHRTPEKFDEELDDYLRKARTSLPAALKRGAIAHKFGRLRFWLENRTEHNFSQLELELHFDQASVSAYFERNDVEGPDFPARPRGWGSPTLDRLFGRDLGTYNISSLYPAPRRPRGHISNGGSTDIRFAPLDIRPGYQYRLATVYLICGSGFAGQSLKGAWFATAADTSGIARGELIVPVSASVATFNDLLSPPTRGQDEGEDD